MKKRYIKPDLLMTVTCFPVLFAGTSILVDNEIVIDNPYDVKARERHHGVWDDEDEDAWE